MNGTSDFLTSKAISSAAKTLAFAILFSAALLTVVQPMFSMWLADRASASALDRLQNLGE